MDHLQDAGQTSDTLEETARVVVDAALEVHRTLGPGFLEAIYEQALAVLRGLRGFAPFAIKSSPLQ